MSTQDRKTGLPEFFTDTNSVDTVRRQFIEAPMEAAVQDALGSALELTTFMSILPGAFVASQQRELSRVIQSGSENDPRVTALQSSIEQAELLQMTAIRGQARVQRSLVAAAIKDKVFHGFVSDDEFTPLPGLTVQLSNSKSSRVSTLSATTDADGYFSIQLGKSSNPKQDTPAPAKPTNLSDRIIDLLNGLSQANAAATPAATNPEAVVGQVKILRKGKLLYSDPVPLTLDSGSVYREYVIADTAAPSASDFRDFVSKQAFNSPGASVGPTETAADRIQSNAEVAHSSASPAVRPRPKKKSPRRTNSTKSGSKN
jgi:hypothetical protein